MIGGNPGRALLVLVAMLFAAGCGAGVAGVVAASGSSGGSSVPASIAAFTVVNPKDPMRATLRFTTSKRATLEFFYQIPPEAPLRMTTIGPNPRELDAGPQEIPWDFANEPGLAAAFSPEVLVFARIPGVVDEPREGENAITLGLGNDPPVVLAVEPRPTDPANPEESAGIVEVRLRISDTSSDPVDLAVEWRPASGAPDSWTPATAAGVFPGGVETSPDPGVELSFFWNTNVDLADREESVIFRVTADDRTQEGSSLESAFSFRVDNNAAPVVQLDSGLLLLTHDERRGIPIPCRVLDEEGDRVELIFQWRRRDEGFPPLPADNAGLDAILADPIQRASKQVCTPYPRYARGRAVPFDGTSLRLPELAGVESWILASGLEGRTVELLRPSTLPEPISWSPNPLAAPVAALPLGDGLTAVVLDAPSGGSWRLRELDLTTGTTVDGREARGSGEPTAMGGEPDARGVVVASLDAGNWSVERVDLASWEVQHLVSSQDGVTENGRIRGILSLGTQASLITLESSLVRLDYPRPGGSSLEMPRARLLLPGLATPWGLVTDPLHANRVYLAERDFESPDGRVGRVVTVELDTYIVEEVSTLPSTPPGSGLERPEALALQRRGNRLLAVTSDPAGVVRQLVGVDLGGRGGNATFAFGAPITGGINSMTSGPDGLLILTPSKGKELLIGGGLEQRRVIEAYEPRAQLATVSVPLDPLPRPGQPWRIAQGTSTRVAPGGQDATFLWDSADARGGEVFLRALPRDDDPGSAAVGAAPETSRALLDVDPLELADSAPSDPSCVVTADLDSDGLEDIVAANKVGHDLTIFFQEPEGFPTSPQLVLGNGTTTNTPVFVAVADVNGDGHLDLVSANQGRRSPPLGSGGGLTIFYHDHGSGRAFVRPPFLIGEYPEVLGPSSVAVADLDGDGDADVASANEYGNNLRLFYQESGGSFTSPPELGELGITNAPSSVAAADLDGDGDIDLVAANKGTPLLGVSSRLTLFFQGHSGGFDPLQLEAFPDKRGASFVAAADLDGDGDVDVVSANTLSSDLTVFFQEAPGSFAAAPLSVETFRPRSLVAADLDGDGELDLTSANEISPYLTAFYQGAPGSFDPDPLALEPARTVVRKSVSVAADDLDGDGDMDLVAANEVSDDLTVFFQASPGSSGVPVETLSLTSVTSVAMADLDEDGDLDLAAASSPNTSGLSLFLQESPGSFVPNPVPVSILASPRWVGAADLDGDGNLDLAAANEISNSLTVSFQLQELPGSFSAPVKLETPGPRSVVTADLDGDGDLDLVSANKDSNRTKPRDGLEVFFQEPRRNFASIRFLTVSSPAHVTAADLEGDGDIDLASANESSDDLTIFFQVDGDFRAGPQLGSVATTRTPQSVAAVDLDGDGDLDLVSANKDSDNLTVFFQEPGGFPSIPQAIFGGAASTASPVSISAVDFDGDGDPDLVSANRGGNGLTVFFQEAPGNFAADPLVLPVTEPVHVTSADLDSDGDQDLVSAGKDLLTIFWGGR